MRQTRWIMGIHSVEELLQAAPERFVKVYCVKPVLSRQKLISELEKRKISITVMTKEALTKKVASDSHQGIIAEVEKVPFQNLADLLERSADKETSFVLILDRIYDPHNLGAILRSAECFQVDAVIWSKNRGGDLTPVVTKTSSGASELVPIVRVSNLADTVKKLQNDGYEVLSTEVSPKSDSLFNHKFSKKTVLIMGSEGEGVQPLLSKKSDKGIYIPMKGQIDSLNVAQATAVILSHWSLLFS